MPEIQHKQGYPMFKQTLLGASVALIACITSHQAFAGAWVPSEGTGYAKIGLTSYSADRIFDSSDTVEFEGTNLSYYGEYGLGNNLGIYWSVLYQDIEQLANGNVTSNNGLGDLDIGVRYQWISEPFVFSTSLLAKLPFLYNDDDALPLGNGQEDIEVRALLGKSLNQYGYLGLELGYRLRTGAPSDEYKYLLEYGYSVNDNLYLRTKLDGTLSASNADSVQTDGINLALTPEFDVGKLELTAGWNIGKKSIDGSQWGVEFTYTQDLYGEQTLDGDGFQIALTHVF